jgi:hypothetical protein
VIWSVSESKTFKRCQRQWYYKTVLGNAIAKDPLRHKVYLLGKLQSISSWRGQVVDSVISQILVPTLKNPISSTVQDAKRAALSLFERQLSFARTHPLNKPGFSPTKSGHDCLLLYCMEYVGTIPENEISEARKEIERAFDNLFAMDDLLARLRKARYLVPQRALCFQHTDVTVRAVPDLIAFYDDAPPLIVDWKVHTFGQREAWLQLGVYSLALTRCKPHKDFPRSLADFQMTDILLNEVQLLTGQIRDYRLSDEEAIRAENYIAESVTQIELSMSGLERTELRAKDFPTTFSPDTCQRCSYRRICLEEADDRPRD